MSESDPTNETPRVAQSDEIVKQLEKSVPRWEGFGPGGWSTTIQLVRLSFPRPRYLVSTVRFRRTRYPLLTKYGITKTEGTRPRLLEKYHDPNTAHSGTRLSAVMDAVPDMDLKLNFPQVVRAPSYTDR
jgi:hypothetical protein